ncbi:Aldo/keto reductase family protein [Handroanthus impetiginosus]|uniref:Aldo/keto reductase family protein n=1 Tax=Handroanthus impetiginosus TaxID=429701 RepID=A0A2G9IBC0_9LAMI|nr:Aldo/keto reductase family protein [Handroanthus impetiginosus]
METTCQKTDKLVPIPPIVLNSGHKMPTPGLGTAAHPMPPPDHLTTILIEAIAAGYRHIDTAAIYGTEEAVGRAVAAAVEQGLIKDRDEVFVTSKLFVNDTHKDLVLPALKQTLSKLGMDYVDLYLIHWPIRVRQNANSFNLRGEDMLYFDIKEVWDAMEECVKMGLAKSIGVSNFSCAKLSKVLEFATIPPAVNQVEMNVSWQQQKMVEFCKEKGIHVCAWSPLGANGAIWGSLAVMESPVLKRIAATKNKSLAQVALRWVYEQGATPIVKSFNKERMKENLQIFNWELTSEELSEIQKIPQAKGFTGERFVFPEGQYKSVEELWDGEI